MVLLGEHEAETGLGNAARDHRRPDIEIDPEARERIGRSGLRAERTVAMLGDRYTGTRDNQRGQRRNVVGTGTVAAGADDVDRTVGRFHGQHACAHRADRTHDLVDRFAAHPKRHQKTADLRWRGGSGHDDLEGRARIFATQCLARCDFGDERLQITHEFASPSSPLRQCRFGKRLVDRNAIGSLQCGTI